jgi:molecular chaperone GrpE
VTSPPGHWSNAWRRTTRRSPPTSARGSTSDLARELEAALDDRDDRIADLEASREQREERISELEEALETRNQAFDELEEDVEDLEGKLRKKQADFKNYKERRKRKEEEIRERATEDLVERLIEVRNNLVRALDADADTVEDLLDGVEMTLKEFDRVLDDEGVEEIAPEPGSEVDPQRHEVMIRTESEHPDGTIAELYEPGYEMGEKVLRSARVTVSEGTPEDPGENGTAEDGPAGDGDGDGGDRDDGDGEAAPGDATDREGDAVAEPEETAGATDDDADGAEDAGNDAARPEEDGDR